MRTRILRISIVATLLAVVFAGQPAARPAQATGTLACPTDCKVYLPMVTRGCTSVNASYGSWPRQSGTPPFPDPAATSYDLNLGIRGYTPISGQTLGLVDLGGSFDVNAPQLDGLLKRGVPSIVQNYQVGTAPWDPGYPNPKTDPIVTLIGFQVVPNEVVYVPASGYDIGGGFEVRVLYAASNRVTFTYTTKDTVVGGYSMHVENLCVDPNLVTLYNQLNAAGRDLMPALSAGQAFGMTLGGDLRVSVRDGAGTFMDPRSRKDWWQGH